MDTLSTVSGAIGARMKTYILLLRGINVGGRNALAMKELVAHLDELSCQNTKTYIQSGNAVFQMRSPDWSARRPHKIINTAATPNGIMFMRPVSKLVKPNDLMICGCQRDSALLVAELPQ